jgi:thiol-disulfide isomerase/thioredoxin
MKLLYLFVFLLGVIILGLYFISNKIISTKKSLNLVKKSKNINIDKLEIILYWAKWCSVCKKMKPVWEETKNFISKKYPNINVIEIECDDPNKCYVLKNNKKIYIDGVPTIILRGIGDDIEYKSDKSNDILCNKSKEDVDKFLNLYLNK